MATGIRVTLQPNGSLLFQANNETRAELAARMKENWSYAEGDFLEMVRGQYTGKGPDGKPFHYSLEHLNPADIFAMTEMPMLADTVTDDDNAVRVYGPVWAFPAYETADHIADLAHRGRAVFPMVANYGKGVTFPSRHGSPAMRALADKIAYEAFDHCLDGEPVFERVADAHGEEGDTIARLVGYRTTPPAPAVGDLLADLS